MCGVRDCCEAPCVGWACWEQGASDAGCAGEGGGREGEEEEERGCGGRGRRYRGGGGEEETSGSGRGCCSYAGRGGASWRGRRRVPRGFLFGPISGASGLGDWRRRGRR